MNPEGKRGEGEEGIGLLPAKGSPDEAAAERTTAPSPSVSVLLPREDETRRSEGPAAVGRQPSHLSLKPVDDTLREVTAGALTSLSTVATSTHPETGVATLRAELTYTSLYPGEGAEWRVWWHLPGKKGREELLARRHEARLELAPNTPVPITFDVEAPVGVRYGDQAEVHLSLRWEPNGQEGPATLRLTWAARQALLAIKTSRGYEKEVADTLLSRAEEKPGVIFALLVPSALRGYVFAEGMSFEGVREMIKGIRKARGLVAGETTLKEVEPLLVPKVTVEGFVEGAIVELIAGPFKGEKARVKKIDQNKEQITVELIEAVVPIPVTVRGDHVRMLERGGTKNG
jgi:transcriptional antiterminator NusG